MVGFFESSKMAVLLSIFRIHLWVSLLMVYQHILYHASSRSQMVEIPLGHWGLFLFLSAGGKSLGWLWEMEARKLAAQSFARWICSFWIYTKFSSTWLISFSFPINLSNCQFLGILQLMLLTPVVLVFLYYFLLLCPRRAFVVFASYLLLELTVWWFLYWPESLFLDNAF